MSVFLLIDGLESQTAPDLLNTLPTLSRLAAVGRTGRLCFSDHHRKPEEGGPHFEIFADFDWSTLTDDRDLPLGYAVALGKEVNPDAKRSWCCLGFSHLYQKQTDLLFLSPERTGQTLEECWTLAQSLSPEFLDRGWSLHGDPQTVPLLSHPDPKRVRTQPLDLLDGLSLGFVHPLGDHSKLFMELLTTGQLCLARHPINLERKSLGRMVLNTPWIWGVGDGSLFSGINPSKQRGHCFTSNPVVAGLSVAGGYTVMDLDESDDFANVIPQIVKSVEKGSVMVHLQQAAVLARHTLPEKYQAFLQRLDAQLLKPLSQALAGLGESMILSSAFSLDEKGRANHKPVPWVVATAKDLSARQWFWNRCKVGEGTLLDSNHFRKQWYP